MNNKKILLYATGYSAYEYISFNVFWSKRPNLKDTQIHKHQCYDAY